MKRNQFSTKFGVIAATVGSAVGLGNIWRFPYEAGVHGGGAFIILNLIFVFIIGIPVICAEFLIGRHAREDVYRAFTKFKGGRPWRVIGWIGIVAAFLILGFYSVVAGWAVDYIFQSLSDFGGAATTAELHARFQEFVSDPYQPLIWTLIFLLLNYLILIRGVEKGIEKMSNIMLPILFVMLVAFMINSLLLPEAGKGVSFLFKPDFSQLTPSVVLGALGQAFFSLSLGMGCLITYASYFKDDTPLVKTAATSAVLDTLVAIMAGLIIFPAVFTFGGETAAGPRLVFEVLPSIFQNMEGGMIWSTLFFVLLFIASLTSTISVFEIIISFLVGSKGMKRVSAVSLVTGIVVVMATLCSLSFGVLSDVTFFNLNFFNLFDYVSSNICLPLGGMLISVFTGWVIDKAIVRKELTPDGASPAMKSIVKVIIFCLRYVAPTGIFLVFIFGL